MRKIRAVAAAALAAAAFSGGVSSAESEIGTPSIGRIGTSSGACVFVGSVTVGNPLAGDPLVRTDPRTGVYTRCPY